MRENLVLVIWYIEREYDCYYTEKLKHQKGNDKKGNSKLHFECASSVWRTNGKRRCSVMCVCVFFSCQLHQTVFYVSACSAHTLTVYTLQQHYMNCVYAINTLWCEHFRATFESSVYAMGCAQKKINNPFAGKTHASRFGFCCLLACTSTRINTESFSWKGIRTHFFHLFAFLFCELILFDFISL